VYHRVLFGTSSSLYNNLTTYVRTLHIGAGQRGETKTRWSARGSIQMERQQSLRMHAPALTAGKFYK